MNTQAPNRAWRQYVEHFAHMTQEWMYSEGGVHEWRWSKESSLTENGLVDSCPQPVSRDRWRRWRLKKPRHATLPSFLVAFAPLSFEQKRLIFNKRKIDNNCTKFLVAISHTANWEEIHNRIIKNPTMHGGTFYYVEWTQILPDRGSISITYIMKIHTLPNDVEGTF
jgi:hypothetical protein